MASDQQNKFLGLDLSTQQLKAIVISDNLDILHQLNVVFEQELSEFKTHSGVYKSDEDPNMVTAPVNMWLKALDLCLDKLKIDGLDFSTIVAISGCAQQHGSVWWRRDSAQLLANLNADDYLHTSLMAAFVLRDSPIWQDSSTTEECKLIEQYVGGPEKLAEITGSRAYERFTGPQIAKIFRRKRQAYKSTERITLISNFLTSIFAGRYCPFDAADASGMNMMNIRTMRWSDDCLKAIVGGDKDEVSGLKKKLGCHDDSDNIVESSFVLGNISKYFVDRYGFNQDCIISSFTGDNPSSLAGLCLNQEEVIISLGTSDTSFFLINDPKPCINGHILRNSIDNCPYMGLITLKNGSKTRERIRDKSANGDWDLFSKLLDSVPRGNFGNLGFYFDLREIYPLCTGDFRFNKLDQRVESFAPEQEIRACLESQFMRLYYHSAALGLDVKKLKRVLVTGGASTNKAILQVIADVFKSPVFTLDLPNSASLGGCFLAKFAHDKTYRSSETTFKRTIISKQASGPIKIVDPTPIASSIDVYELLLERCERLEREISINNQS